MSAPAPARPPWLTPLTAALRDPRPGAVGGVLRPGQGGRAAAVLCLLGEGAAGPEVLFVERAATLRTHAGQIAFPGGAADPDDVDLVDTALREAEEEVGVLRERRRGARPAAARPRRRQRVRRHRGRRLVARPHAGRRRRRPARSRRSRVVPVAELTDPAHRASVRHPSGYTGPAFEVAGHLIWGLTAHLLDGVLDLAGWQRPWDATARSHPDPLPAGPSDTTRPDPEPGGPDAH